jgi:hypothetical protein
MNSLNAQQLAFILDIKKEDARAKLCHAWCKFHGIENKAYLNDKKKIVDDYPERIPIGMISQTLCIDNLQTVVDDIILHYLTNPVTKKYILCDFPEKELATKAKNKIKIPSVLKTFLSPEDVEFIKAQWLKRYGIQC